MGDRDREAFFADRPAQGRPWQPFFQNAPSFDRNFPEADSLASAFRSPRFGMGSFPGDTDTTNSMQNNNMKTRGQIIINKNIQTAAVMQTSIFLIIVTKAITHHH